MEMDDVTGSMLGILPPVIAAGAVMGIMNNSGLMGNRGNSGGVMFGAPAETGNRIDGSGSSSSGAKISLKTAGKLFGANKVELAKTGVEVTNADGDILIYNAGNFYLLEAPELPRLM